MKDQVKNNLEEQESYTSKYKCEKCKKEFVRELIYNCSYLDYFWEHYFEYYGCSHCFQDKDEFVKWLQDTGRLYTEDSLRKICKKRGIG